MRRRIDTPRLRLRALAARDLELFCTLYCDAQTMRYIGKPQSRRYAEASFRATIRPRVHGPWFFAIVEKAGGNAVGVCAIQRVARRERCVELGMLLVREARGRGYAVETLGTLVTTAFRALPIDMIWVQYRRTNAAAARLCDALGFAQAGDLRPVGAIRGQRVRVVQRAV